MNKDEKAAAVEEMTDRLNEAEAIFAIDYRGISVPQAAELRSKLAEAEAVFSVVKNRLAKRAIAQAGAESLEDVLAGPTALALIKGDPVTAAKAISTFGREHNLLEYKGGIMDGAPLDADGFVAISRLPALEVLHGQMVGVAASPLTGLVRGLGSMMSGIAIALGQIQEQGLVSGEPPAEEVEEAPAEEADEEAPAEAARPDAGDAAEETHDEQGDASPEAAGAEAEDTQEAEQGKTSPDAPGGEAEEASGTDSDSETEEEG